jgi:hypothetical protein
MWHVWEGGKKYTEDLVVETGGETQLGRSESRWEDGNDLKGRQGVGSLIWLWNGTNGVLL